MSVEQEKSSYILVCDCIGWRLFILMYYKDLPYFDMKPFLGQHQEQEWASSI